MKTTLSAALPIIDHVHIVDEPYLKYLEEWKICI